LAQNADNMSKGDLDTSVEVTSSDEIGELAVALERMRASLKAAFTRLNQ
jgi:HAMP domain-containing protein